jgi:hypothetical protein
MDEFVMSESDVPAILEIVAGSTVFRWCSSSQRHGSASLVCGTWRRTWMTGSGF